MTLPDRETVRAVGRPQFAAALQAQGRTVIVRRSGVPDVQVKAIVIPVINNSKQANSTSEPTYNNFPWKVFFRHDIEAVKSTGFNLIVPAEQEQATIALIPDSPTVDIADQGVVLMVLATPLVDRTRLEHLTFTLPGTGTVRDKNNNPVPAPGPQVTIPARLSPTTDPKIRDSVGADAATVVLIGRWGSLTAPLLKPDGLTWGSKCPLVLDGQAGTLTVKLAYPDPDLAQEQQFGARFIGLWAAGGK